MKKHTYRIRFRHAQWSAGHEVELTEQEAAQLENERPGLLERLPDAPKAPAAPPPRVAKDDA